jgi:DAK2 domain fusion protein YloV
MTSAPQSPALRDARLCNGAAARDLLEALACWLETHADHLNALNVFPVPDGDTGINMSRTLRAAADAAASVDGEASAIFTAASRGALLGAAGNSGVILSQMLRGFSDSFPERGFNTGDELRTAFESAWAAGYKSVARPVEGTILSVGRAAAEAIQLGQSVHDALGQAVNGATEAVEATPSQLEKLRLAGVVDAGGEGLRLLLDGAQRWIRGEDLRAAAPPASATRALVGAQHTDDEIGFCTQFIIEAPSLSVDELKAQIEPLSTSIIVVGSDDLIRVHAHAAMPGALLDLAVAAGTVSRISIENMDLQHQSAQRESVTGQTGVVAVAQSLVAARLLESLGATTVVVPAEASPSVNELLNAVQRLGHAQILILPSDENAVLAAEQLQAMTSRSIHIVPTENVVQTMQCLLALNPDQDLDAQASRLVSAATSAAVIELARANRAADLPAARVAVGDVVAIQAGEVTAAGLSVEDVAKQAIGKLTRMDVELVTLHPCADIASSELGELENTLRSLHPDAEHDTVPLDLPSRLAMIALE